MKKLLILLLILPFMACSSDDKDNAEPNGNQLKGTVWKQNIGTRSWLSIVFTSETDCETDFEFNTMDSHAWQDWNTRKQFYTFSKLDGNKVLLKNKKETEYSLQGTMIGKELYLENKEYPQEDNYLFIKQ